MSSTTSSQSTYLPKHAKYYKINARKQNIALNSRKYSITIPSATRLYEINALLSTIRATIPNYKSSQQFASLMIEKTQLMYKGIVL